MANNHKIFVLGDCPAWAGHRAITAASLRMAPGDPTFYRYPGHFRS